MTKLKDILKSALEQKQEQHAPKAKKAVENNINKSKSTVNSKPVKKASGRGK